MPEAKIEEVEPCPFCGVAMQGYELSGGEIVLVCKGRACGYRSARASAVARAIAAHNRVSRAARGEKAS